MKKTILIVDDVADNIRVLKSTLEAEGHIVRAATSGKKALELARVAPHPNIILLDVMMPGMDGIEVCRELKANPKTLSIPVIFVTTKGDVDDETIGFDVGAVDYITKPISPPIVVRRVATHLSLIRVDELDALARSAIRMLGEAGHFNDTDTGEHIWRMAAYSKALAIAAGWEEEQADMLELAAPMHDTGKIGIPDSILKAPRKLNEVEWQVMMTHSAIGSNILSKSNNPVFELAAEIAQTHHEKWDGSGYPKGLKGEEISEAGRIVAIADVFDALTMKRPYKEPWAIKDAMKNIKDGAGIHFDPKLVEVFISKEETMLQIKEKWS
jgi:putative two-component system response regulator